jgi:predicted ferric reductase
VRSVTQLQSKSKREERSGDPRHERVAGCWNCWANGREWVAARWYERRWWGVLLCLAYPAMAVTPLALFVVLQPASDHWRLAEVGVDAAVVAFTLLALQFVLAARLAWVEAPFGLDLLMRFHRTMALVAVALLCAHPVLLAVGGHGWGLLMRWRVHWYVWAGRLALAVLLVHIACGVLRARLSLAYEAWRRLHNVAAMALLGLGFVHSAAMGDDMSTLAGRMIWSGLLTVATGAWLYGKWVRPLLMRCEGSKHLFRVTNVKREGARVWTVDMQPLGGGRRFAYAPGQFQFVRFHGQFIDGQEHPFTIASSPTNGPGISLTIKESGDFTYGIGRSVRVGDQASVQGPMGRFSHVFHPRERELVFVAAGVGITPMISMLRYMAAVRDDEPRRRVVLVYTNRTPADILFQDELREIEAGGWPAMRIVHVLTQPPASWGGETGRVDAQRLLQWSSAAGAGAGAGANEAAFYLCCPPAMTAALIHGLRRRGVSTARIHTDYFSI